jgi:hypothetical protein
MNTRPSSFSSSSPSSHSSGEATARCLICKHAEEATSNAWLTINGDNGLCRACAPHIAHAVLHQFTSHTPRIAEGASNILAEARLRHLYAERIALSGVRELAPAHPHPRTTDITQEYAAL